MDKSRLRGKVVGWDEKVGRKDNPYAAMQAKRYTPDSTMLLIDARLMSYASAHTRKLSTSDGVCTSVLHGLVEQIQGLCEAANTRRWLLVWDGVPSYRRRIFKGYKVRQDRDRTPEEVAEHRRLVQSMKTAVSVADRLGWPQAVMSEVEADDLIGVFSQTLLRHAVKKGIIERVVLVTEDKDYYQLIRKDRVVVYRHRMGEVVDESTLMEMYGLSPRQYIDYKALIGESESGDNIPHVNGIGDVTARKLVAVHKSIPELHAHLDAQVASSAKLRKTDMALYAGKDITNRAYTLSRILTKPKELVQCYPGDREKLCREWREAHAQLLRGLRLSRPAYLRDLAIMRGKYEFDSFEPQRWCSLTGFKISI